jgi:hypothetical protein
MAPHVDGIDLSQKPAISRALRIDPAAALRAE